MAEWVFLIVGLLIVGALALRYIYWTVDREMRDYARAVDNPAYRAEELVRITAALEKHPGTPDLIRRRAELLDLDSRPDEAVEAWHTLLSLRPDDDAAWSDLADLLLRSDRPAEAADAAEKALSLDSRYPEYARQAAAAALAAGDPDRAQTRVDQWRATEQAEAARRKQTGGGASTLLGWRGSGLSIPTYDAPVPGLAQDLYDAAILLARGRREEAERRFEPLRAANPDTVDRLLERYPELAALDSSPQDIDGDPR